MKYVKHQIPEEISDKGGASVQLVAKQTIPLDGAIDAALEAHYCIGQKPAIMNNVFGALKSMAAGVRRDGRPRRIDGFLGLYPVFKGKVDLTKGFDPAENKVQIKARLLNELVLNTKKWTFEDVTPGKRSFTLDSVKAGSVLFVVKIGEAIQLNGQELPSTRADEELRIHWAVEDTDKSGDIPASKMTSDVGRADIAADALAELASEEYDGKTIVFTVRGNFASAKISATLKYVAPPVPTVDHLTAESRAEMGPDNECEGDRPLTICGANLADVTEVKTAYTNAAGESAVKSVTAFTAKSATELKLAGLGIADVPEGGCMAEVSVIAPGGTATLEYIQLIPD
mgnify:CR=1 FL=1